MTVNHTPAIWSDLFARNVLGTHSLPQSGRIRKADKQSFYLLLKIIVN